MFYLLIRKRIRRTWVIMATSLLEMTLHLVLGLREITFMGVAGHD